MLSFSMLPLRKDAVLLYDGVCGLCDGVVQFVLAHDRTGTLRFATLQGAYAAEVFIRHPELRAVDSLVLLQPASATSAETVMIRSDAALALAQYLGRGWAFLAMVLRVIPRVVRDVGYNMVARSRYRVFGRRDACRLPSVSERTRFID